MKDTKPAIEMPLYRDRPQRKIPHTDGCIAVTMYASRDRTVREYSLFAPDGSRLGDVTSHTRSLARAAGYHRGHGVWRHDSQSWSSLTEAALDLLSERD